MTGGFLSVIVAHGAQVNERLYQEDFCGIIASRITHPFLTTARHEGSIPFDILSNSACAQQSFPTPPHARTPTALAHPSLPYLSAPHARPALCAATLNSQTMRASLRVATTHAGVLSSRRSSTPSRRTARLAQAHGQSRRFAEHMVWPWLCLNTNWEDGTSVLGT